MKVVINFSTLKSGGGQNVALNFLMSVNKSSFYNVSFLYIAAHDSLVHRYLEENVGFEFILVSSNPIKRIFSELTWLRGRLREFEPDIIYSYFGYGFYGRDFCQVTGSADSNLYFPEIDFWKNEGRVKKIKRWLVDKYRLFGLRNCQGVVYENRLMEQRAKELFGLKNTVYIGPSIVSPKGQKSFEVAEHDRDKVKLLFLCGWQRNKQVMLIPLIAATAKNNHLPFLIFLTAPVDDSSEHREFASLLRELDVENYIRLVGPVHKEALPSLFNNIDYVMLLSKLESFSNNIIEAWYYQRNLVIADEPWARSLCGNAALYVNRESAEDIVKSVAALEIDGLRKSQFITAGIDMLSKYPTVDERITQELAFLRRVCEFN